MARRRFQNPAPRIEGNWWVLYYWADEFVNGERRRRKKREKLAPAKTKEREVKKIAAEFLRPLNQGLAPIGSATAFEEYVDGTYIPVVMKTMAKSTASRYEGIIKNYLRPQFAGLALRDISPLTVDEYFAGMTGTALSWESLDKVRDVLSSILSSAVRYRLLVTNPAEGVRLPRAKKSRKNKPWIFRVFTAFAGASSHFPVLLGDSCLFASTSCLGFHGGSPAFPANPPPSRFLPKVAAFLPKMAACQPKRFPKRNLPTTSS